MGIDLNRIDGIEDVDEALEALEDFVEDLVDEFAESPEGKRYLQAHPEMTEYIGSWIDNLLYFGYAYQSVTLPKMTQADVEAIVTGLFPRKITLLDPDEADTTLPELLAFWQFLKRAYKHPHAAKIIKYLETLQPTFKGLMTDPSNFGMAKSILMAGQAAGFDMTTEEGVEAFQAEFNQQANTNRPSALPPGLEGMLGQLMPPGMNLKGEVSEADLENLIGMLETVITGSGSLVPPPADVHRELRTNMWEQAATELPDITEDAIALLTQQTITPTEPGTIVKDFQTLLDLIGDQAIAVSNTNHLFPAKFLTDLNQRLSQPIQLDLKRPVQKSYPAINGLYLLLRATGLGQVAAQGKKYYLSLNPEVLDSWNSLNPTEQYFTLLEAWFVRSDEEMLGERRSPLNEGSKCIQFLRTNFPQKGLKFKTYADQQNLNYWPELHNLALLDLFGLVELQTGKPDAGKGWRVKAVTRSPFGDALIQVMVRAFMAHEMVFASETDPTVPFGELQADFQPYFPAWEAVLTLPAHDFQAGVHIFKVSLGKIWRKLAIAGNCTLEDLSYLILESVGFDSDHLDMYTYKDQTGRTVQISHPQADGDPSTDEVQIGNLPLSEGTTMEYVFDFGDWWKFTVQLETIQAEVRPDYREILEQHGKAPEQYPNWDEEDEEWDEDDADEDEDEDD